MSRRRPRGCAHIPDTADGLASADDLSIGGHRVTDIRLSGKAIKAIKAIAGIITSLPPVTSMAPS